MPGKKDNRTPADSSDTQEPAGTSVVSETSSDADKAPAAIDLMEGLAVGNPGLKPTPAAFRGTEFAIRKFYTPETVWEMSDLQRQVLRTSEEWKANLKAQLEYLLPEDDHGVIDTLVAKFGDRTQAEVNRFMRRMYQVAGLANDQGEFLAF